MKRCQFTISQCICPDCKNKFPIPRKISKQREKGHLKDIWCPFCKETKTMLEIRESDTYLNSIGEDLRE